MYSPIDIQSQADSSRTRYSETTVYCGIHERTERSTVDSGLTNLIHDRCSCTLFTLSSVDVSTQA